MSDSLINIIINTVKRGGGDKEAVSGVRNLSKNLKELTGISLGSMTAMGAAGAAAGAMVKFLKDSVEETVKYATEVDNMSRLLGISTEDTSRLIQASDDLFVSQEKLQSGLQAATRQGIDVSIEGLKSLSAEYLALPEGVARSEFVMKTFGRSGAEMGKLMEIGASGIDEATAAIAKNMIITDQSMVNIMNYKRSVDNLEDSWQGVKYTVGQEVIPALDLLFRNLTKGTDEVEEFEEKHRKLENQLYAVTGAYLRSKEWRIENAKPIEEQLKALEDAFYGVEDGAGAAEEGLEDLGDAVIPVSAYMSELTKQLIFNQASAGLDAEASLALAKAMGLVPLETEFAINKIKEWKQKLDDGQVSIEEYNHLVKLLGNSIREIPDKTVNIRVVGEIDSSARAAAEFAGSRDLSNRGAISADWRAAGGPVFANTPYIVGEVGPELFIPKTSGEIVPNHRLGGNNININISGAGDPNLVANAVMRKLRLQGVG